MASALDKQLAPYRARPQDESGALKTKVSLIFDPREASFVDKDTFYQIGFQGFATMCRIDGRFEEFSKSIFAYSNTQIDPLFLTAEENKHVLGYVEKLLYLLSNYVMEPAAVQILEYLIQQFAVNRMRPAHLILVVLPYLETSLFVRIMQTIPFKTLPHEFKFVRMFSSVATSKKPLTRVVLRDWIMSRPTLLQWIMESAGYISELHPNGVFSSFVGVLFAELCNFGTPEMVKTIVGFAKQSFDANNGALAANMIMSVVVVNEKHGMNERTLKSFAHMAFKHGAVDDFEPMLMASAYLADKVSTKPSAEFLVKMAGNLNAVEEIAKRYVMKSLAEKFVDLIVASVENEDVMRSATALLETSFFNEVGNVFLDKLSSNFVENEYSQQLIEGLVGKYPEALTTDVIARLNELGVKVAPGQMSLRNLQSQLSNPSQSAALYSNPALPYEHACAQVVFALKAAKESGKTDCISPIIQYFQNRAPDHLIEYLTNEIFLDGSEFSVCLNKCLRKHGKGIAPHLSGLPSTNSKILSRLSEKDLSGAPRLFPIVLAQAVASNSVEELLDFLPIKVMDYEEIARLEESIVSTGDFLVGSDELRAALVLATVDKISAANEIPVSALAKVLDFPDIRCIAPIIKNVNSCEKVVTAFELSTPEQQRLRVNVLYYIAAIAGKIEDPVLVLPCVFMALLDSSLIDQVISVMKSFPLKDKDVKIVLTQILRQSHNFKTDEKTLRNIFNAVAVNPKSRDFFDRLWANIHTAEGCGRFWSLTNDTGVIKAIQRFPNDRATNSFFMDILKKLPDCNELKSWAMNSLNSRLIRDVIPFLGFGDIKKVLYPVCAYPRFYSEAFTTYFLKLDIDGTQLAKILKDTKENPTKGDVTQEPPDVFPVALSKLKASALVSPSTLILELLPLSKKITDLNALVPTLFTLLKSTKNQPLVFACLLMCLDSSAKYIVDHFAVIIAAITESPVAHVHATVLKLMSTLARKYPNEVAEHATALFTTLSSATLFSDDSANLTKIKQILTVVLPILAKLGNIDKLLSYLAENLEQFSVDRATQLMIHSIHALGDDSYKVFEVLLNHGKTDFALLLADQLMPEELLTALIRLAQTDMDLSGFITQIQLPPSPKKLLDLFGILSQKMDVMDYFKQTCSVFGLADFIDFMKELIPTSIPIQEIIHDRIESETSPLFAELLPALEAKLKKFDSLDVTMTILADVAMTLNNEQAPKLIPVITVIMDGINDDRYTIPIRVQALCLMATVIERFDIKVLKVFPVIVGFASELFSFIVNSDIAAVIPSTAASVCLLLKTSPLFCCEKMHELWTNLLSPNVYKDELRELVETSIMTTTNSVEIDALVKPFVVAYKAHVDHPDSLILLFKAFENSLKQNADYIRSSHQRIMKFFLCAFNTRCEDWEMNTKVQDAIISAFSVFISQLTENLIALNLKIFNDHFMKINQNDQSDYLISRIFYIRTLIVLAEGIRQLLSACYGQWCSIDLEFLRETNDAEFVERNLTCCCLDLIQVMAQIIQQFFDKDQFTITLPILMQHASVVVETDEQYMEKIVGHLAPAFAALVDAAKDDALRRMADLAMIELMRNKSYIVRIAGLKVVEESFRIVGGSLTPILPEIGPALHELLEDPHPAVQEVARDTYDSISQGIGESISSYLG